MRHHPDHSQNKRDHAPGIRQQVLPIAAGHRPVVTMT